MGTNYYLINKSEQSKLAVAEQLKTLAAETIQKLKELIELDELDRQATFKISQAIMDTSPERERIHIGKNSFGWRFTFHEDIKTFKYLETIFNPQAALIEDEYGRELSLSELKTIVLDSLNNPKRDASGAVVPEPTLNIDSYSYFSEEGFAVMKGDFS